MYLKFFKNKDGVDVTNVVECSHYQVIRFSNRVDVVVYKDYFTLEGVSHTLTKEDVTSEDKSYRVCFVENINGKTIDTIRVK